mmetsp:Transcript_5095/g.7634  ORF Transcript_5095/g.7634 Transcript_5095/m.7634 type:complete len:186 (-) Transcript_5095:709-1266(-)
MVVGRLSFDSVLLLKRDYEIYLRLKGHSWTNGDSIYLTWDSACVLPDMMESAMYLASGLRTIITDTGASLSISNDPRDFPNGCKPCEIELQGIVSGLKVKGKGMVQWLFQHSDGRFIVIECMAYYAPDMKLNLFSPQSYFLKEGGGSSDFPNGYKLCEVELQGIGSGLKVKGKGMVRWRFQLANR